MKSHSFPPFSRPDARILILGSLPGQVSLKEQRYYAHPQNKFWPIMGELIGASPELPYAKRIKLLLKHKIALWDVCKSAVRPGSLDSSITQAELNDFSGFLDQHPAISLIAFNGQHGAGIFKKRILPGLSASQQAISCAILPSTSPAHAGMRFEEKLARWRDALVPHLKTSGSQENAGITHNACKAHITLAF